MRIRPLPRLLGRSALGVLGSALAVAALGGCSPAPDPKTATAKTVDVDGDGIPDDVDECVTEKEDGLAPLPKDGCKTDPDDPDGDGVAQKDKCPTAPEVVNGYQDGDGCPDELPEVVVVAKQELRCDAQILFASGKATIEKASDPLITNIAEALKSNPEIEFVEVAGHADATGDDRVNLELTRKRALAVVDALSQKGVARSRLRSAGYGAYCPLDPGDTDEAKERNRRVEFKIVVQQGAETGVRLGCEQAAAKGIKPEAAPKGSSKGT
jgi:OmpA-OmpF porin, OOP family